MTPQNELEKQDEYELKHVQKIEIKYGEID